MTWIIIMTHAVKTMYTGQSHRLNLPLAFLEITAQTVALDLQTHFMTIFETLLQACSQTCPCLFWILGLFPVREVFLCDWICVLRWSDLNLTGMHKDNSVSHLFHHMSKTQSYDKYVCSRPQPAVLFFFIFLMQSKSERWIDSRKSKQQLRPAA